MLVYCYLFRIAYELSDWMETIGEIWPQIVKQIAWENTHQEVWQYA